MISIKITSNENLKSIIKKQVDAEALEKWAREAPYSPLPLNERMAYLKKLGRNYQKSKVKLLPVLTEVLVEH